MPVGASGTLAVDQWRKGYVVHHSTLKWPSEGQDEVVEGKLERWAPQTLPTHSIVPVRER